MTSNGPEVTNRFAAPPYDPNAVPGRTSDDTQFTVLVGGLVGTLNGEDVWPEHLSSNVQDVERLLGVADSFADVCSNLILERECASGGTP